MKNLIYFFSFILLSISCQNEQTEENSVTGKLILYTDEAFHPLISSEKIVFEHFYKKAKIDLLTTNQEDAIDKLLNGDAGMITVSRDLNKEEREYLESKNIKPQAYEVAYDGIVFIVSKERADSVISPQQLKDIFSGTVKNWSQFGSKEGELSIVFNQNQSSDLAYLSERFKPGNTVKIYAAGSTEKVIDYVKNHSSTIGVIGLGYISDEPEKNKYLKSVKALAVKAEDGKYHYPSQSTLATSDYPYKRNIYLISKFNTGLTTGFVSFVLTENGQRIVLKSGLLPAKMPGREVIIKKEF